MTSTNQTLQDHFGDHYGGLPLTLHMLADGQWLIVLTAKPQCALRLSPESDLTKQLDSMGISDEHKTGLPHLDDQFVIRADSDAARQLLQQPEVLNHVRELAPFVELELTAREYRLIKDGLNATPEALEAVLRPFSELVRTTQSQG
jgi:hypothetical protein